jgi:hypothetical protein
MVLPPIPIGPRYLDMFTSSVENSSDDSSCLDQAGQASQPNNAGDGTLFLVRRIVIVPDGLVMILCARNMARTA